MKNNPDFEFEMKYWRRGFDYVVGIDEVGRGALAGPVVAAAAAIKFKDQNSKIKNVKEKILRLGINDSKKLVPNKRKLLSQIIPEYFYVGIGLASVGEINKMGIVKATDLAMFRSFNHLTMQPINHETMILLIDGNHRPDFANIPKENITSIVKGDAKSITIAAASIMAKVHRDSLMVKLAGEYPEYGWEMNKGYGTKKHIFAVRSYGILNHHRDKFIDGICML